ncbi:hypothetical protein Nmel_003739 [Mimus melanotis]
MINPTKAYHTSYTRTQLYMRLFCWDWRERSASEPSYGSCNASVQKKNAAGHSALDLAVAAGDNKVISLFQVSLDREH